MVYNRLTDFMLEAASSATLRAAYLAPAVVLTPHLQAPDNPEGLFYFDRINRQGGGKFKGVVSMLQSDILGLILNF